MSEDLDHRGIVVGEIQIVAKALDANSIIIFGGPRGVRACAIDRLKFFPNFVKHSHNRDKIDYTDRVGKDGRKGANGEEALPVSRCHAVHSRP